VFVNRKQWYVLAVAISAAAVAGTTHQRAEAKPLAQGAAHAYDCAPVVQSFTSSSTRTSANTWVFHFSLKFNYTFTDFGDNLYVEMYGYGGKWGRNYYPPPWSDTYDGGPYAERFAIVVNTPPIAWDSSPAVDHHEIAQISTFSCGHIGAGVLMELPQATKPATPQPDCPDYFVIDSRGSDEEINHMSSPGASFGAALHGLHPGSYVETYTNPYPAVGKLHFVGAVLKLPTGYYNSVKDGKRWLKSKIGALANLCPDAEVYLTGYSQGAQIVGDVYQQGYWPTVKGVVLFGDPYFNSHDPADRFGFNSKKKVKTGLGGALGTRPLFSGLEAGRVLTFCHQHDPVCQHYTGLVPHLFTEHKN